MSERHLSVIRGSLDGATVEDVLSAMRTYLALDDADHVLFSFAVAVAANYEGDPCWGLLVGAPSSGKTETLRALDDTADEHLDEITAAGLLSWLPGRNPKPTGLLSRRQGRLFATVADLSTLLAASDRGSRDQLYALLRRAYDGRVVRELGNAPAPLRWEGQLTLLAAVTPAVDNYSSHADALGPRWLFFRLPATDATQRRLAGRKARESGVTLAEHRTQIRGLASATITAARRRDVQVGDLLGENLIDAAMVACLGRAAVPRDGYGRREIIGLPVIEEPPRLVGQLEKLARGLLALGLSEAESAALCRRAAIDSMPLARAGCLATLAAGELLSQAEVARRVGCDRAVARVTLEELAAIGVATYEGADEDDEKPRGSWHLAGADARLIQRVFAAPRGVAKSGVHPHIPQEEKRGNPHFATPPEGIA